MNDYNNIQALDMINLLGFIAQINNIQKDGEYHEYMEKFFKQLFEEIQKLHKENDIIIKQNEKILKLLEKDEVK